MDDDNGELRSYQVLSAFVNCTQQGRLPGCEYRFDDPNSQCINGREGSYVCACVYMYVCMNICSVNVRVCVCVCVCACACACMYVCVHACVHIM